MIKHNFVSAGFVLAAVSTFPITLHAAERQLDAHEHGHSFINIARSGEELLVELITPAANVVGFEHAPKSDSDHEVIDAAAAQLAKGDEVFSISGASCTLQDSSIESSLLDADHDEDHDDHKDADHDDHDEEHDDHKDDDHKDEDHDDHKDDDHDDDHKDADHGDDHDDHDDHDDESSHSEFHVVWAFACTDIAGIMSVDVNLFTLFSGFEEIDISVATESGQSAHELTPSNIQVNL